MLPSFLESALISLESLIETWELISGQISDEQLRTLKHGCELLKDTHQELETDGNAARSTDQQTANHRVYKLRGQRVHYDGSVARSDQRRKRRRTADRLSVEETRSTAQTRRIDTMLGSPDSIEHNRSLGPDILQDDIPDTHGRSLIGTTHIPSPATSAVPERRATESESLFIPECSSAYHADVDNNSMEDDIRPDMDTGEVTDLQITHGNPNVTLTPPMEDRPLLQSQIQGASRHSNGENDPFQLAFDEFIEEALSHPFPNDVFALYRNSSPGLSTEEQEVGRIGARFHDLINRREFWLPHEDRRDPSAIVTQDQILGSLSRKEPLTSGLIHGILYRILPDVFDIVELGSHHELQEDLIRLTSPDCERSVLIVSDKQPELVLVDTCRRKLTYVTSRAITEVTSATTLPADWIIQFYNPSNVDSSIEQTLLSVYLVEAEYKAIQLNPPYVDFHIRQRYFEALLVREEQQAEVRDNDICIQAEVFATRPAEAKSMASSPIPSSSAELHIDQFDPVLLREALSQRPKHLKDIRCLRILQYVYGTGGPQVLDHLKVAAISLGSQVSVVAYSSREAHAAKISAIHTKLDSRGPTSHLGIAQSRFAKLCYYREFQHAVESLRRSNKARRAERQKLARHQQRLEHVADNERSDLIPQTIAMGQQYSETTGRSSSVVRDDVVRRLSVMYERTSTEDQAEIKLQVDSYIRQGKILHLLLQGCSCDTSPAVLLLVPTLAVTPLDVTSCVQDEKSKQKLRKPFKPSEIDDLSEMEAQWMGEALRILRPEIMAEPPGNALRLLQDGPTAIDDIGRRDSKQFAKDPFGLFA